MRKHANGSKGDLRSTLAELKSAKLEVDEVDDELSKRIALAEKALAKLKLGVRISVELAAKGNWAQFLAFDKYGNRWRLVIEEGPDDGGEPDDWQCTPLSDTNREMRAQAFERLPELLEAGIQQIRNYAKQRRELLAQADALLAVLASETAGEE